VTLRDLGERRLRDLRPEPIFQLVAPDLPSDFPPLKTLDRPTPLWFSIQTSPRDDLPKFCQSAKSK